MVKKILIILVFKQRMQLSGCKRALRYAKMVFKTEGPAAIFRSLPITIVILNVKFIDDESAVLIHVSGIE